MELNMYCKVELCKSVVYEVSSFVGFWFCKTIV